MGACPSRNRNQLNNNDKPKKLSFIDGSSYEGDMIFLNEDRRWIQHGNGIYIFQDGTTVLANFENGEFNLMKSVRVTYAGGNRQYSGRMSMFEGQPFPHGEGVLTETKQGRKEKQEGEFRQGVLYNGLLNLNGTDTSVNIEVKEGKIVLPDNEVKEGKNVLPDKSKNASQNRTSWYDQLEEQWKEQKSTYGYSDQDVWLANQAAEKLIKEEGGEEKPKPIVKLTRTTNRNQPNTK